MAGAPNLKTIGSKAFLECTSLTTVTMPKVTTVFGSAFYGCTSLHTVIMPESKVISMSAFYGCKALTSAVVQNYSTIAKFAFNVNETALISGLKLYVLTSATGTMNPGSGGAAGLNQIEAKQVGYTKIYKATDGTTFNKGTNKLILAPTVEGANSIYANGTPITIEAGTATDTTKIKYNNGIADVYVDLDATEGIQDEADLSTYFIYGGSSLGGVASTSVTMKSGKVNIIVGAGENFTTVDGDTNVTMKGGTVESVYGGVDAEWGKISGDTNVTMTGGTVSGYNGSGRIYGGYGQIEGSANIVVTGGTTEGICGCIPTQGRSEVYVRGGNNAVVLVPPSNYFFADHFNKLLQKTSGEWVMKGNVTIPAGVTATIDANETLKIPKDSILTLLGGSTLDVKGTLVIEGTLSGTGTLTGNGTFKTTALTADDIMPIEEIYTGNAITPTVSRNTKTIMGKAFTIDSTGWTQSFEKNTTGDTWVTTTEIIDVGKYKVVYTKGETKIEKQFNVVQSGTTFGDTLKTYKAEVVTTEFSYGDTITVKATPKATGQKAKALVPPSSNQMALFVGSTQISQAVNGVNGVYTMTYDTKGKALAVGSNIITAKYVGNESMADYSGTVTVTLNKKAITSASVNAGATKVYDGNTSFTGVTLMPNATDLGSDTVTATADGTTVDANVGATKAFTATSVTLGGAQAGYYSLAAGAVSGNVAITKAEITGGSQEYPVVNGLAKEYSFDLSKLLPSISSTQEYGSVTYTVGTVGNTDSVLTASPTNSDIANGELTLKVASVADKDKTATVSISITTDNFTVTNAVITVKTVDKTPLTITANMGNAIYNGSPHSYTGTPIFTNSEGTAVTGITHKVEYEGRNGTSYTKSETAPTNAGEYNLILTVSGASADTYAGTLTVPFAITPKEVTVKAKGKDILVGAEIPSLTTPVLDTDYTVAGFIGTDTLGGTVSMSYTGTPDNTKSGSYPITISGGTVSDNYTVKYENGTLTISIDVSLITAAITAANKAKGGIAIYDTAASSVENGTKFVTTAEMSTLNTAIQTATNAKASCTTLEQVQAAAKALNDAVADFKAAIKTGTYTAPSGGGGGGYFPPTPTPDPTAPIQPKEQTITNADGTKTTVLLFDGTKSGTPAKGEALLSAEALAKIAAVKGAGAVVATSTSIVQFDQKALQAITGGQTKGNIKVIAEIVSPDTLTPEQKALLGDNALIIDLSVENENGKVTDFNGGTATVVIKIPAGVDPTTLGAVYIKTNGKLEKVEGKVVMVNGVATFQFVTNHFSKFAVLDKATIAKAIAAQDAMAKDKLVKGVKATKLTAIKAVAKKSNVTVTWKKSKGYKVDGYQIWKSSKKTTGYKMMAKRTGQKYKNTYGLKSGKTYYYKVRGFREIDGKIVYTKWAQAKVVAK